MRVLIIGYGSIGTRHYEILDTFSNIEQIDVVTKQDIENITTFINLDNIDNLNKYDYFIISSETIKHYNQLKYICSKVIGKKILVEKPLYDKNHTDINCNNQIFTAYNLRFHPIIDKLKNILIDKKVYYANIVCGQYLPTWRSTQDYKKSYSAHRDMGGGVLRDLSHELDYMNWLFGDIEMIESINTKISDLEISSDDIFTSIIITNRKTIINLTVDYISKIPTREMLIHTEDITIKADIINNTLIIYNKDGNKQDINIDKIDRNYTYNMMHRSIIDSKFQSLCSFNEGKKIVDIIDNIEYKEL